MVQRDLVLGAFDNYDYKMLSPWVNSIKESGFSGDIVLICFNASFETVDKLVAKGIKVIACEKSEYGYVHKSNMPIHTERFFHFFNVLKINAANYRYVITTDVKDIIFQKNPSEWLEKYMGYTPHQYPLIIASSESIKYKDEPWGNENMEQCFGPYFHAYFKNRDIYNVGVIAGESRAMRDICLNIFLMSTNRPIKIVDQAVWNSMLYTVPYSTNTIFTNMHDSWAVHLGTTMDPLKIDQFRPLLTEPEPKIKPINHPEAGFVGVEVVNAENEPFYIVHQWDRIPELNQYYRKKYDY